MPCVIVPTCLIEIKKALLYTTPIKANQLTAKPMLFSRISNKQAAPWKQHWEITKKEMKDLQLCHRLYMHVL